MRIMKINKVFLPLGMAVKKAAEQNLLRDHREGIVTAAGLHELDIKTRLMYYQNARNLLKETGENYPPPYPDRNHICLKKEPEDGK